MKINEMLPVQKLDVQIRARYPVIWIRSQEESRVLTSVLGLLTSSSFHRRKDVFTWSMSRGLTAEVQGGVVQTGQPEPLGFEDDPIGALQ